MTVIVSSSQVRRLLLLFRQLLLRLLLKERIAVEDGQRVLCSLGWTAGHAEVRAVLILILHDGLSDAQDFQSDFVLQTVQQVQCFLQQQQHVMREEREGKMKEGKKEEMRMSVACLPSHLTSHPTTREGIQGNRLSPQVLPARAASAEAAAAAVKISFRQQEWHAILSNEGEKDKERRERRVGERGEMQKIGKKRIEVRCSFLMTR